MFGQTASTAVEIAGSSVATRKSIYRKTSVVLAFVAAGISLASLPFGYFLLVPLVVISMLLFVVGGVLVWDGKALPGALLILLGGFGGSFSLPWLLWRLIAIVVGNRAYGLPLLPLGLLIPLISFVLALMSRESSGFKFLPKRIGIGSRQIHADSKSG